MDRRQLWTASRRTSLVTLITSGLAVFTTSVVAAKNKHGKNRRKIGDPNKRCKKQSGALTAFITTACEDVSECQDELACATPLKTCDFEGFLVCLFEGQGMIRSSARGTAGFAAHLHSIGAEAKNKKRARKRAEETCRRQAGQCIAFFIPGCEGDPTCLANVERCCAFAGSCDAVAFVTCVVGG